VPAGEKGHTVKEKNTPDTGKRGQNHRRTIQGGYVLKMTLRIEREKKMLKLINGKTGKFNPKIKTRQGPKCPPKKGTLWSGKIMQPAKGSHVHKKEGPPTQRKSNGVTEKKRNTNRGNRCQNPNYDIKMATEGEIRTTGQ